MTAIFGPWLVGNAIVGGGLCALLMIHNFICWAVEYSTRPSLEVLDVE